MMMRNTLGLVFVGSLALAAVVGTSSRSSTPSSNVVINRTGDPAMDAAYARGRATLPTFYSKLSRPNAGMGGFAVKVGLDVSGGQEFVWLSSPSLRGGQITGVIANKPVYTTNYRIGQSVQFPETAVVDWTYKDAGQVKGNFTACAIASKMPPAEKQKFEQEYSMDCSS